MSLQKQLSKGDFMAFPVAVNKYPNLLVGVLQYLDREDISEMTRVCRQIQQLILTPDFKKHLSRCSLLTPIQEVPRQISIHDVIGKLAVSIGEPRTLTLEQATCKARKNMYKSIEEHGSLNEAFITWEMFKTQQPKERTFYTPPLTFTQSEWAGYSQFGRQDRYFVHDGGNWLLVGVCDGHASADIAEYVKIHFVTHFISAHTQNPDNIFSVFERAIHTLQKEIVENYEKITKKQIGAVAVFCFFDKKTGSCYTATLGDCEAMILRQGKLIPLSCVRNYRSKYDCIRLAKSRVDTNLDPKSYHLEVYQQIYKNLSTSAKYIRNSWHLNVSRGFGDKAVHLYKHQMVHKSKITGMHVCKGDLVILASDGLFDFVTAAEIVSALDTTEEDSKLAEKLGTVLKDKDPKAYFLRDDATIMTFRIN